MSSSGYLPLVLELCAKCGPAAARHTPTIGDRPGDGPRFARGRGHSPVPRAVCRLCTRPRFVTLPRPRPQFVGHGDAPPSPPIGSAPYSHLS
jgi:hypothetical protein